MEEEKPKLVGGVWPTVKPSVNGVNGASGMLAPCVVQPIDIIKIISDRNQVLITENLQTLQNTEKYARGDKWDTKEDMALMSAWCIASENRVRVKKHRLKSLWAQVKELYDEARAQNPEKLGVRNENQIKGRWKRINENANKWIAAYKEAYKQKTNEMSMKDVENEAHKIYGLGGNKFSDCIVFNEVMCKHPKWELLTNRDMTCSRHEYEMGNNESGGSTKRTRTIEEVDHCVHSNSDPSDSGGSTIHASKKKRKCKVLEPFWPPNEYVAELRAIRIARQSEVEIMRKRLDLEVKREERKVKKEERELKKEERKTKKMTHMLLNTLLAKEHLSLEDEQRKRHLVSLLYGM